MAAPDESPAMPAGAPRAPQEATTATFVIDGPVTRAAIPDLCDRLHRLLEGTSSEVIVCDVGGVVHADAVALDVLARLQLTARRAGRTVQFRAVSDRLQGLLALTGFAEVLALGEGATGCGPLGDGDRPGGGDAGSARAIQSGD